LDAPEKLSTIAPQGNRPTSRFTWSMARVSTGLAFSLEGVASGSPPLPHLHVSEFDLEEHLKL